MLCVLVSDLPYLGLMLRSGGCSSPWLHAAHISHSLPALSSEQSVSSTAHLCTSEGSMSCDASRRGYIGKVCLQRSKVAGQSIVAPRWLDRREQLSVVVGPSNTATRRLDRLERLPGEWTVEGNSPEAAPSEVTPGGLIVESSSMVAEPSTAAPRMLDHQEQPCSGWTVESSSMVAEPSTAAPRMLDHQEQPCSGWTVESSSMVAEPSTAAPWMRRRLLRGWTTKSSPVVSGPSRIANRRLHRRERVPTC